MSTYDVLVWNNFQSKPTAREAVSSHLFDFAAAMTGHMVDIPRGCMVTLSAVDSEGYEELGKVVRSARVVTFDRLEARFRQAVSDGEIPAETDIHALARFTQAVRYGMAILSRDGISRAELENVAHVAMLGGDTHIAS